MTLNVVSLPATTTIDLNKAFTMQGMFDTVYGSLPNDPKYTVTGISFEFLGMSCKSSGVFDTYADIKEAISRLYNYCMKSYLEPIWKLLNALLKALEAVVGSLLNVDLSLPVLNLTVSDLFSDDLYEKLIVSVTNLYNTAIDDLKHLLNLLGIPFQPFSGVDSPPVDIPTICKNILVSLWGSLIQKIKSILDAIKLGLTAYDYITEQPSPPFTWSTIWNSAVNAILEEVLFLFETGGPTVQEILDALIAACKAALNKTVVTAEDLINYVKNFRLPIIGKPFDWLFPLNPHVDFPWKDINQLLADMKLFIANFLAGILAEFIKAIDAILSLFGLSLAIPVLRISYSVCATINEGQ